jgi:signal peptidase I
VSVNGRVLLGVAFVLGIIVLAPFAMLATGVYRLFHIPSESMMPTFQVGDRFVARMSPPASLNRGDIILIHTASGIYVQRVAGLPGDRIELVGGIVHLNGRPVPQRLVGEDPVEASMYRTTARRLSEQFPGEASPHEIYDSGASPGDDFAGHIVAPSHVFTLGDNRDHSADSRFSREEMGVGQVALSDIRGAPSFFYVAVGGRHRVGDDASH